MSASIQILLATYNGGAYIAEQIESLLVQDFGDFEVLVSDDGSDDDTVEIVERYAAADARIRLIDNDTRHGNARDNFFFLLSQATAPYVAFCDQDDLWLHDKLSLEMDKMHQLENTYGTDAPLLVFTDLAIVDKDLSVIDPSYMTYSGCDSHRCSLANLLSQNLVAGCTIVANRSLYHDTLRFPADINDVSMHDCWLALTAAALGHIGYVNKPTMLYRQHGDNSLGAASGDPRDIIRRLGSYTQQLLPSSSQLDTIDARLRQSSAFGQAYADQLDEHQRSLCEQFSHVLELPPLRRLHWCHTHDVHNASPMMRLGMAWELLLYDQGRKMAQRA